MYRQFHAVCNPLIHSFLFHLTLSQISEAITRSSNQSHRTCPEPELSMLQTVPKVNYSDCQAVASRQSGDQLNPKCMT